MQTQTTGTVTKLEAEVVNPYSGKEVVGTMVTTKTDVMVEDKAHTIITKVFIQPNSNVPRIGDEIVVAMTFGSDG